MAAGVVGVGRWLVVSLPHRWCGLTVGGFGLFVLRMGWLVVVWLVLVLIKELVADEAFEAAKLRARGEEPEPTVRGLVELWVKAHVLALSPGHVEGVERNVLLHCEPLLGLRLGEVSTELVEGVRNAYLQGHARSSANTLLAHLLSM